MTATRALVVKAVRELVGWKHFSLDFREVSTPRLVEASVDVDDWSLRVHATPGLSAALAVLGADVEALRGVDPGELAWCALRDAVLHEGGHWRVVPRDVSFFEEVVSGVASALSPAEGWMLFDLHAAFTDVVNRLVTFGPVRTAGTDDAFWGLGETLLLRATGQLSRLGSLVAACFARTSRPGELRGEIQLDDQYHEQFAAREERLVGEALEAATGDSTSARALAGEKRLPARVAIGLRRRLKDPERWWGAARQFALLAKPLLAADRADAADPLPGDGLLEKFKCDPRFRRELVSKTVEKGRRPNYLFSEDGVVATDERLKHHARRLRVVHAGEEPPVVKLRDFRFQEFDPCEHSALDVQFFRTLVVGDEPKFFVGRLPPVTVEDRRPERATAPPDALFWFDSSGSVGQRGYETLLLTVVGIEMDLEERGKLAYANFCGINFSDENLYSGWKRGHQLDEVKAVLYEYQGGDTRPDPATLERAWKEAPGRFVAFMETDGLVKNDSEGEIVDLVRAIASDGNDVVFVQKGEESPLFRALAGVPGVVRHVVRDARDVPDRFLLEARRRFF